MGGLFYIILGCFGRECVWKKRASSFKFFGIGQKTMRVAAMDAWLGPPREVLTLGWAPGPVPVVPGLAPGQVPGQVLALRPTTHHQTPLFIFNAWCDSEVQILIYFGNCCFGKWIAAKKMKKVRHWWRVPSDNLAWTGRSFCITTMEVCKYVNEIQNPWCDRDPESKYNNMVCIIQN